MANGKQDGSNILNLEYTKGLCETQCESCFVNFGDRGLVHSRLAMSRAHRKSYDFAVEEGKRTGLYTPPAPVPPGVLIPKGHEPLLGEITEDGQGLFGIPMRTPTWGTQRDQALEKIRAPLELWVEREAHAEVGEPPPPRQKKKRAAWRKKLNRARAKARGNLADFPMFLRVSTMSDSLRAPADWLARVRNAWRDHCFFNTSIRTARWAKKHHTQRGAFDELHKLVVTTNPGRQGIAPVRPAATRLKGSAGATILGARWRRLLVENGYPSGSFCCTRETRSGFLRPQTLPEVGLGSLESLIKFYRLRALPTIWPHLETDQPIVITMLRFKGPWYIADWARAYGFSVEYQVGSRIIDAERERGARFFPEVAVVPYGRRELGAVVRVWSDPDDPLNDCPDAGEPSSFVFERAWYRPVEVEGFDRWPYVCDRALESCKGCGLCAVLDGTQPGWTNPLNIMPWGEVWPLVPGPEGAQYLNRVSRSDEGDFFADLIGGDYRKNPRGPLHVDDALGVLDWTADYFRGFESFCEGWDTHEDAETARDLAVWSTSVWAKSRGMDVFEWIEWLAESTEEGAIMGANLLDVWDEIDPSVAQFVEGA